MTSTSASASTAHPTIDAGDLVVARVRAQVRGIDTTGMDAAAIGAAVAAHDAAELAHPPWLYPGFTSVAVTAETMLFAAEQVLDRGTYPDAVAGAVGEVLRNAAGHTPAFSGTAPRPYGCSVCGCADGVGACDTWMAGLALTRALLGDTLPARPVTGSPAGGA